MTRYITQSMFIIISNKTPTDESKRTESFSIVTVMVMMCAYTDVESVAHELYHHVLTRGQRL